ncbi:MAG: nuclear transport factor 2 family protein [Lachnospiraceae bacterium]|nr:nuclear transport factor 2 family protein [Lachnospiraceae bacterium]
MDDKSQIADNYRKMYWGMIQKDRNVLESILHDTFVLVHMTGMQQSREAYIHAIEDGTLNYYSAIHEAIEVTIDGNNALLTGESLVGAAVFGGSRSTWRLRLKINLISRDGNWFMTRAVASTY